MMKLSISRILAMLTLITLLPISSAIAQEITLSEPLPSFDEPRKIILQLSSDDPKKMNDILWNAVNLQKFYGMEQVSIKIVAFGRGMNALYEKSSPVKDRIHSLLKYEIEFIGCGNTMDTTNHTPADLIPGVEWVQAGIAEIIESKLDGWVYIAP